jgi:small subunit ribosomal protein S1
MARSTCGIRDPRDGPLRSGLGPVTGQSWGVGGDYVSVFQADKDTPHVAVNDVGTPEDLLAQIDKTIKYFDDGDIVEGTVVLVGEEEVLVDIGYKTEGVVPAGELSIRGDVEPSDVVSVGDDVESLVLQKSDREGRLILSILRAGYERAWVTLQAVKERGEPVRGTVIKVVKGAHPAVCPRAPSARAAL